MDKILTLGIETSCDGECALVSIRARQFCAAEVPINFCIVRFGNG